MHAGCIEWGRNILMKPQGERASWESELVTSMATAQREALGVSGGNYHVSAHFPRFVFQTRWLRKLLPQVG